MRIKKKFLKNVFGAFGFWYFYVCPKIYISLFVIGIIRKKYVITFNT